MIDLVRIDVAVQCMIDGRRDPIAVAGSLGGAPLLADHANLGHAPRRLPGQLDHIRAKVDPHILDIGQENKRAERDRRNRLGPAALAQDGIADGIARRGVRVVELARANFGDPGAVGGVLEQRCPACGGSRR